MQEPPADRAATGSPANGAGSPEFAELRRLLIGQDLDQLAAINDRLDNPARRSADFAQVLPDPIRAARVRNPREAFEPIFEKSFQRSVRKHPRALADAISPVTGPPLRASIRAAARESAA